jgi:hypothetical protein
LRVCLHSPSMRVLLIARLSLAGDLCRMRLDAIHQNSRTNNKTIQHAYLVTGCCSGLMLCACWWRRQVSPDCALVRRLCDYSVCVPLVPVHRVPDPLDHHRIQGTVSGCWLTAHTGVGRCLWDVLKPGYRHQLTYVNAESTPFTTGRLQPTSNQFDISP